MPSRDVFALDRSGFNGFLFAAVGTEANGSSVSVLSTLARLGDDPWVKAASWARMSKAAAGEALAACICQMPVTPEDLQAAPSTAAQLVLLLSPAAVAASRGPRFLTSQSRPKLMMMLSVLACAAILLGVTLLAFRPSAALLNRPGPSQQVSPTPVVTLNSARPLVTDRRLRPVVGP
jgi:hypothetical protein